MKTKLLPTPPFQTLIGLPVFLAALALQHPTFAQDKSVVATPSAAEPATRKAPVIESINTALQPFVDSGEISGVVTLVGHEGAVVHVGALGLANLESEKPMRGTSTFSIASMTKPIAATALMILVEEGKVNLDDSVSKYLPAYANLTLKGGEAPKREITIRDAVTHTSGLSGKQTFPGTLAEFVDSLAKQPLDFEPGSKWQYSPGLNVVGRIVEVVAEQPFEQFLQERIFDPLRMANTTFAPTPEQLKKMATLYELKKDDAHNEEETPSDQQETKQTLVPIANRVGDFANVKGANPSGGLVSTARDMFRFYQMALNGGTLRKQRIISEDSIRQMTTKQTGDLETGFTPGNCWGLGWCIIQEPQGVTEMLSPGTFGHGGAFGTQGWVDPKTKTIYVLMIQREGLKNADASEMRKAFQQAASDALGL